MPEFVMEGRDHCARAESDFVLGFIEAMFFTETGHISAADWFETEESERYQDGQLPSDVGYCDLHPDSLAKIRLICERWQFDNANLLQAAYKRDYDATQAGRDYWFTGNGHGVGFLNRKELKGETDSNGLTIGEKLHRAALYKLENYHAFFGDHVTYGNAPFVHFD